MEISHLVRDDAKIHKAYTVLDDGSVIANRPMEIHIPKRFVENGMAVVGETVWTSAVLGLVIPGECYAPLLAMMDITLVPLSIREAAINGVQYLILEFGKGDTLIENLDVLQDPNKPHQYYLEFNLYAKIPWYMNKDDLTSLYDYAQYECGGKVGSSPQVMRVLIGLQFRDPDNLDIAYRHSKAMLEGRPPAIVGLNNSAMLIDGTFSKLLGGYLQDNTLAAIVNPDTKVTDLEEIIKGVPK
jgi:hypothetical protein